MNDASVAYALAHVPLPVGLLGAAMLAGVGIAIGAAWGGMLGNFAAGAFRLVLRPFKVGDFRTLGIAWQYTFFD
jgi:small-conductance mechanosensitive channel